MEQQQFLDGFRSETMDLWVDSVLAQGLDDETY
jgi:hypothetical protein